MSNRTRIPDSLDDLLSANRDRLDEMFANQMAGGALERAAVAAAAIERSSLHNVPTQDGPDNVVAELNRKFGLDWSSRTVGQSSDGERVTVEVELTIGERSFIKPANSRSPIGSPRLMISQAR